MSGLSPENLEKQPTPEEMDILIEKELIEESGEGKKWVLHNATAFRNIIDKDKEVQELIKQGDKEGAKEKIKQELEKEKIH